MADQLWLYGRYEPTLNPINLGSFVQIFEGYDVGNPGLEQPYMGRNPLIGARVDAYSAPVRTWTIPVLLASMGTFGGVSGGLRGLETQIRSRLTRGAYLDFKTGQTPTSEIVRFPVIGGLYESYNQPRLADLSKSLGKVTVYTEPYGYWPTWVSLACVTGSDYVWGNSPMKITINPATIIGDGPIPFFLHYTAVGGGTSAASDLTGGGDGWFYSIHMATQLSPSNFGHLATRGYDFIGGGPGVIKGGSYVTATGWGFDGGAAGDAGTNLHVHIYGSWGIGGVGYSPSFWANIALYPLWYGSGPQGPQRVFLPVRNLGPSPLRFSFTADRSDQTSDAMATAYQTLTSATLPARNLDVETSSYFTPSIIWNILDLGMFTFGKSRVDTPRGAMANIEHLRIFAKPLPHASWGSAVASLGPSQGFEIGPVVLMPAALTGAIVPTYEFQRQGIEVQFSGDDPKSALYGGIQAPFDYRFSGQYPVLDMRRPEYRLGSWLIEISLFSVAKKEIASPAPGMIANFRRPQRAEVLYRPTFSFIKGL